MGAIEASIEKTVERMEAQLKVWGAKLDELLAKANQPGEKIGVDYYRRVENLGVRRDAAQARLDEFRRAGSDKWEGFKVGLEKAWSELEVAVKGLYANAKGG